MSILEKKEVWRRYVDENRWQYQRPSLTGHERDNVRRALSALRMKYGRSDLAARMGLTYDGMRKTLKRTPTRRVAVLIAFVVGVKVVDVLAGRWPSVCPHCGRCE